MTQETRKARACPACGRPNADRATICLYCSQPLPSVLPVLEAIPPGSHVSLGGQTSSSAHLVILAPSSGTENDKAPALASAAALGLYEARLALQAKRYRLLRKLESEEPARSLSRDLAVAGIAHHLIAETELQAVALEALRAVRFRETELELSTAGGGRRLLSPDNVLLLVRGEITRSLHREAKLATPRGASQSLTPSHRLHLYTCTSGAFDLDPEKFEWEGLDEPPGPSALINLNRLISAIRKRAPLAELDEGFALEPAVLSRTESGGDPASTMLARDARGSAGVIYDNQAQFHYYARWRYLVALASR